MSHTLRPLHRKLGRCRPRVERLETRLVMAASATSDVLAFAMSRPVSAFDGTAPNSLGEFLSVALTDPAPGVVVTQPLVSLTVKFDRPIDPSSLSSEDAVLLQQNDGSWVPVYDLFNSPIETADASGTALVLSLTQSLDPGVYQLVLPEYSGVRGLDGSAIQDVGSDTILSQFTVSQPGITLHGAHDLGIVTTNPADVAGTLDLQNNPGAVQLYKFTLPTGHFWRVGAEVIAQQIGSSLRSTLALFDSSGHPIATASLGLPYAPNDAFLFEGLGSGTYYLGVSGQGNIPGNPGGYDPGSGQVGSLPQPQMGGTFHLNVVADPADAQTKLLGFKLDHADPRDTSPTGITLAFSGLLDLNSLRGDPTPGIELINQNGQTFPLVASSYHGASAQYSFQFDQALPAGSYTIRVPKKVAGGATDLADMTPIAQGQADGVLATFVVSQYSTARLDPNDLGPLYEQGMGSVPHDTVIQPGTAVTYRFVTLTAGKYDLGGEYTGGRLVISVNGADTYAGIDAGPAGAARTNKLILSEGVHYLQFINTGTTLASLSWNILQSTHPDSQLDNGVGQGPALGMRFVNPSSSGLSNDIISESEGPIAPAPSSSLGSSGPGTPGGIPGTATNVGSGASSGGLAVAPGGLYMTIGNSLAGRPSSQSESVGVVGPGSSGGSVALASSLSGVPQGINFGLRGGKFGTSSYKDGESSAHAESRQTEALNGSMALARGQEEPRQDELVIATAELVTRAAELAAGWFSFAPAQEKSDVGEAVSAASPIEMARDDTPATADSDRIQQAQFSAPVGVGLCTLMAMRFQSPLRKWLGRTRINTTATALRTSALRGPHRRI